MRYYIVVCYNPLLCAATTIQYLFHSTLFFATVAPVGTLPKFRAGRQWSTVHGAARAWAVPASTASSKPMLALQCDLLSPPSPHRRRPVIGRQKTVVLYNFVPAERDGPVAGTKRRERP
jgi:hypothetical protein